jgi:alkaline ceramidase
MVFVPPIAIYLFRDYARRVNHGIQAVMVMLMVVGVTSMYFHGTLSLMGQLMDELSILWV